jgi:hypothetical protein
MIFGDNLEFLVRICVTGNSLARMRCNHDIFAGGSESGLCEERENEELWKRLCKQKMKSFM